jgi:hypothetical protein
MDILCRLATTSPRWPAPPIADHRQARWNPILASLAAPNAHLFLHHLLHHLSHERRIAAWRNYILKPHVSDEVAVMF